MPGGRPHIPLGTHGEVSTYPVAPTKAGKPRYKAKTTFRGADGRSREIARFGQTKGAARQALREAVAVEVERYRGSALAGTSSIAELGDRWFEAQQQRWAVNTRDTYAYVLANQVKPHLGAVRLCEIRPAGVTKALREISGTSGVGAAKTAKTVLTGMFDYAVGLDAITANPARVKIGLSRGGKSRVRALTPAEVEAMTDAMRSRAHPDTPTRAEQLDVPDLVDWMLGTGMRIGEACAVRSSVLDLDAGTVEVNATVVRVKGVGTVIQERPKTAAGWRVLALPRYLVEMLRIRQERIALTPAVVTLLDDQGKFREVDDPGIVFPSPNGHLRDGSNTSGDLREVLDTLLRTDEEPGPFGWVHSHVFRKTVATRMDESGCSPREVADQLGHSKPSMTLDVYMGRNVVSARAAEVLDR